jgi:hypothetical protein
VTATPDRQRSRVYAWEDANVAPLDRSKIAFSAAQGMVDAIWRELGLQYPPRVEPLPAQARVRIADADRLTIRLPALISSWCLLHELAHCLTTTADGQSDGHGPDFMGIYVRLLRHYSRLSGAEMRLSLAAAAIDVRVDAEPAFVDRGCSDVPWQIPSTANLSVGCRAARRPSQRVRGPAHCEH